MTPSPATVLDGLDAVRAAAGRHLGHSDWVEVNPVRVDRFAEAVGGRPLSDPYLVLSLSNLLLPQVVEVRGAARGVNYGVDRVRFPVAVRPGGRLRAGVELLAVTEVPGGVQTLMRITMELAGSPEPAGEIDAVSRWLS